MSLKVADRVFIDNDPSQKGTIIKINDHPGYTNLPPWYVVQVNSKEVNYFRAHQLSKISPMKKATMTPTVKFLDQWKRILNIYALEIQTGVRRNTIAHALSTERRTIDPFEEGKILEKLKQLKRDIEKLKLP